MASDAALGFLQGLSGPLELWAEGQNRLKINRDSRAEVAAEKRAYNTVKIDASATLLADRLAGSEERGDSWNALKKGLIRTANHNPAFLTNIQKDIVGGTGRYTFGDKGQTGSIQIIPGVPLWRSNALSEGAKKSSKEIDDAVDAHNTISSWIKENPNKQTLPSIFNLLVKKELQKESIQGMPIEDQQKKAKRAAMYKLTAYMSLTSKFSKFSQERGITGKSLSGFLQKNPSKFDLLNFFHDDTDRGKAERSAEIASKSESGLSNLWGLLGDEDAPTPLQALNLNLGQQKAVNEILSQIADFKETSSGTLNAAGRRMAINRFLEIDSMVQLPDDRRQAIRELLEAAFN